MKQWLGVKLDGLMWSLFLMWWMIGSMGEKGRDNVRVKVGQSATPKLLDPSKFFFCVPCFFPLWIWNVISSPCNRIKRTRYCCAAGSTLRKKISSLPLWPGALPWEPTGLIWTSTAAFASAGVTVKQSICVTTHGSFCWFTGGYIGIISLCFKQNSIIQSFLAFCVRPVVWQPGPGGDRWPMGKLWPLFPSENIFQII